MRLGGFDSAGGGDHLLHQVHQHRAGTALLLIRWQVSGADLDQLPHDGRDLRAFQQGADAARLVAVASGGTEGICHQAQQRLVKGRVL